MANNKLITALTKAKSSSGGITNDRKRAISEDLGFKLTEVEELATYYPHFTAPDARYNIRLCKSLGCHMEKSRNIKKIVLSNIDINKTGITKDGMLSFRSVNCLGACGEGPAMMVNDRIYTGITPEKALEIIIKCKSGGARR